MPFGGASPSGVIERFGFSKEPLNKANDVDVIKCLQDAIDEAHDLLSIDAALNNIYENGTDQQKRVYGNLVEIRAAILVLLRPRTQKILGTWFPLLMADPSDFQDLYDNLVAMAAEYYQTLLGSVPSTTGVHAGVKHGFCDPDDWLCPNPQVRLTTIW